MPDEWKLMGGGLAAQRVLDEKRGLDKKLATLDVFISVSPIYRTFNPRDRDLLREQRDAMARYSNILAARIERF